MPSGRESVGGGVRTQNYRGGTDISREEKRAGRVRGFQEGGGGRVTQGDPLSPTIFNLVVDVVVQHWFMLAVEEAESRGGAGG